MKEILKTLLKEGYSPSNISLSLTVKDILKEQDTNENNLYLLCKDLELWLNINYEDKIEVNIMYDRTNNSFILSSSHFSIKEKAWENVNDLPFNLPNYKEIYKKLLEHFIKKQFK